VSLFATIPNSGPGLGAIAFDKEHRQFLVSDFDAGLIYRIDMRGTVLDSYDHGVSGRPAIGQDAVSDDAIKMDITAPSFDSENPETWGLTQPERRVWGLTVYQGRLYYATWTGPQVWSVGLGADGAFANDPRREFDVAAASNPIADMTFDS